MAQWRLSGDILHAGVIVVEADTLDEALNKAEKGEFTVEDEQSDELCFIMDGSIIDKDGEPIEREVEPE